MRPEIVSLALALSFALLATGCSSNQGVPNTSSTQIPAISNASANKPLINATVNGDEPMNYTKERVELTASDGTKLVGSYYDSDSDRGLVLLHQLDLDRSTWDAFAQQAQRDGYVAIAIDFRGHGESQGSWRSFTDKDFQDMLLDAEAAASYLQQRGKRVSAVLGASIGANTVFRYSSIHHVPAVLLSPGLAYHGIDINDTTSNASTLIVVARGDTYAYGSSVELDRNNLFGQHDLLVLPGTAHGTYLLAEGNVTAEIFGFLGKNAK